MISASVVLVEQTDGPAGLGRFGWYQSCLEGSPSLWGAAVRVR